MIISCPIKSAEAADILRLCTSHIFSYSPLPRHDFKVFKRKFFLFRLRKTYLTWARAPIHSPSLLTWLLAWRAVPIMMTTSLHSVCSTWCLVGVMPSLLGAQGRACTPDFTQMYWTGKHKGATCGLFNIFFVYCFILSIQVSTCAHVFPSNLYIQGVPEYLILFMFWITLV